MAETYEKVKPLWEAERAAMLAEDPDCPCGDLLGKSSDSRKVEWLQWNHVYFLQANGDGPIKIGWTINPDQRLSQIGLYCPYPITELLWLPATRWDEKRIHHKFRFLRMHNEWFRPAWDLLAYVEKWCRALREIGVSTDARGAA